MANMRYEVYVVYPDGNPIEIAQFIKDQDAVNFVEMKRNNVNPVYKLRVHYGVTDTVDPETNVEAMLDE